ncbi:MAG: putative 2-5 ligase [Moraxellaceae bacterium]|jgi:2'-5' RNA ligase|nr:putative 2-5 ligase [Moraxellaceae bacterium]
MRLFFALWPDAPTQQAWSETLAPYLAPLGGRRIPARNLHLTLAFLGEVRGDRMNELLRLGGDLDTPAFTLRFDRIEYWKKAGLACLRAGDTPPSLARLGGQLATGLQLAGFPVETRAFKPHVTLLRNVAVPTPSLPVWPVLEWPVPALALVRSRTDPDGSEYAVLHEWPLR